MADIVLAAGNQENCKRTYACGANYWSLGIIKAVCQAAQNFFFDSPNDLWSIAKCTEFCRENDFLLTDLLGRNAPFDAKG